MTPNHYIQIVCFNISIHRTLVCLEFQVNLLFARVQRWGPLFWGRCFEINGNVSKVDDGNPKSLGMKECLEIAKAPSIYLKVKIDGTDSHRYQQKVD